VELVMDDARLRMKPEMSEFVFQHEALRHGSLGSRARRA
jgi:hypothetical protein